MNSAPKIRIRFRICLEQLLLWMRFRVINNTKLRSWAKEMRKEHTWKGGNQVTCISSFRQVWCQAKAKVASRRLRFRKGTSRNPPQIMRLAQILKRIISKTKNRYRTNDFQQPQAQRNIPTQLTPVFSRSWTTAPVLIVHLEPFLSHPASSTTIDPQPLNTIKIRDPRPRNHPIHNKSNQTS